MVRHFRNALFAVFTGLIAAIILVAMSTLIGLASAKAATFELSKVAIESHSFLPGNRDVFITQNPNLPDIELGSQYNLSVNFNMLDFFYWKNTIYSRTDRLKNEDGSGQFRYVSWEYRVGARVTDSLSVEYYHRSQHLLDVSSPFAYPSENGIGIQFTIYENNRNGYSIF